MTCSAQPTSTGSRARTSEEGSGRDGIGGGVSQEDAEKAVSVAHQVCPYSRATRGNVEVTLDVEVA